jgi:hypothetical protein
MPLRTTEPDKNWRVYSACFDGKTRLVIAATSAIQAHSILRHSLPTLSLACFRSHASIEPRSNDEIDVASNIP